MDDEKDRFMSGNRFSLWLFVYVVSILAMWPASQRSTFPIDFGPSCGP